jgi:hypothetical protein
LDHGVTGDWHNRVHRAGEVLLDLASTRGLNHFQRMRTFNRDTFNAFAEDDLSEVLRNRTQECARNIRGEQENYILNVNREDYVKHLVERFTMSNLVLDIDQMTVTPEEMLIRAEYFPRNFHVYDGKSYPRLVLIYEIPVNDVYLMRMQASTFSLSTPAISIATQAVTFAMIEFGQTPGEMKNQADGTIEALKRGAERVNADINSFNSSLRAQVEQVFDARKSELLQRRNYLAALNVPVKATNQTASTYAAGVIKRTPVITAKPAAPNQPFKPDPTLEQVIYEQILKLIHDVGVSFEKLPSTFANKGEEDLRDHFLLALAPNFQGATTGETFNKTGKTDILMRHETSNLFVAECKFWKGPKTCLETISQLIGYLTWRDSKAAVIFFVRNANFSDVLASAKVTVPQHPNFLGETVHISETWSNYRFHVNGDRSREIKVAIMFFHFHSSVSAS